MTDDLGYTPGTGATVATDNVGGKHYQRMKVVTGPDGSIVGDVSAANPMPVADANAYDLLLRLVQMQRYPFGADPSINRTRGTVIVESGTITTVSSAVIASGTLTTVTGITNFGNYSATQAQDALNRSAWADCVRARIT